MNQKLIIDEDYEHKKDLSVSDLLRHSGDFVVLENNNKLKPSLSSDELNTKYLECELKSVRKCNQVLQNKLEESFERIKQLEQENETLKSLQKEYNRLKEHVEELKQELQQNEQQLKFFKSRELVYWKEKFQNAKSLNERDYKDRFQEFYQGVRMHKPGLHFFAYSSEETSEGLL